MRNHTAHLPVPATLRDARADARLGRPEPSAAGYAPVFVDPTARRARRAMLTAIAMITSCALYVTVVATTMLAPVEPDTWTIRPDPAAQHSTQPLQSNTGAAP